MLPRWLKQGACLGVAGGLLLLILLVITALASPFTGAEDVYLPLIMAQRPSGKPSANTQLLITELVYNPLNEPAMEPAGEWLEIFNPSTSIAILSA